VWKPGSKLLHPFNPELGVGVVREVEGRFLLVYFPVTDQELTLSTTGSGLHRLVLSKGDRARLISTAEEVQIETATEDHRYRLADGREVPDADVWPDAPSETPVERLATLRLDKLASLRNRVAGLELMKLREAGGLGSFLGGRIDLFPHQLHVARKAVESDPVRWLLADEVGLGKTVEACLVLSALLRTRRAERALVLAPSTLTIQWLGELYRKFHQVFVVLDHDRIESVELDYGEGVNPFDVHPFAVASLELLGSDERLLRLARDAGLDVVVVDEAHRLAAEGWIDEVGPLVREARHALLLTATPLQADRQGFFLLLQMLHPDRFPDFAAFEERLEAGEAELPCTSAVRRREVGGLPPREPRAVDLELPPNGRPLQPETDPRALWLARNAPRWAARGEKALVFVHERESLEALTRFLESKTRRRVTVFHEGLSAAKRDIEIAAFRESPVPLLISTEAGGEGRNFQFCDRMVHFDLPLDPVQLEQRIGRLDRIGREKPVEIVYFRHLPSGASADSLDLGRLYEQLDLFGRPAAGLDAALAGLRPTIEAAAREGKALDEAQMIAKLEEARSSATRNVASVFYRDAYTPEMAEEILDCVPDDLEAKTLGFAVGAAEDLGFECVEKGGSSLFYLEFGSGAKIDSLPGVEGGSRFLGTFDRAEAVAKEELEFFASGHPLIEGLLLEIEDGNRGRAVLCELNIDLGRPGAAGMLGLFKDGADWQAVVIEANGTPRSEWVEPVLEGLFSARNVKPETWGIGDGWSEAVRGLAEHLVGPGEMVACAFFRCK